jgi:hypothetical protein
MHPGTRSINNPSLNERLFFNCTGSLQRFHRAYGRTRRKDCVNFRKTQGDRVLMAFDVDPTGTKSLVLRERY